MMRFSRYVQVSLPVLLLVGALLPACGSDDDGNDEHEEVTGGSCGAIEEACAGKDDGVDQVAADCHELAHDGTDAECEAQQTTCVTHCQGG